jgi:NADH dehydrogenase
MGTTLVIGATGILGGEVVRRLRAEGQPVRALVRPSSDRAKVQGLEQAGAEIAEGDLKHPASLAGALVGVSRVVSTASSTLSRSEGDSIGTVDRDGQVAAVSAAKAAGVEQFVLLSFPPASAASPLQDAKRAAEDALRASGTRYTILQPTHFWEVWFSPGLGFDAHGRTARLFGDGTAPMNWVSFHDVAAATVRSLGNAQALNQTFSLGGPEPLSQLDIVRMFEEAGGQPFAREHVPLDAIRAQHGAATDPLEKSFAALMLTVASGEWVFDSAPARAALGIEMTPARAFARHTYGASA